MSKIIIQYFVSLTKEKLTNFESKLLWVQKTLKTSVVSCFATSRLVISVSELVKLLVYDLAVQSVRTMKQTYSLLPQQIKCFTASKWA